MKRVFIIHGWSGHPKEAWLAWLGKELESRKFEVNIPRMPETDEPKIDKWVGKIKKVVGRPDVDTFFVGHSIGCQAILRYLETLPNKIKIGGAVLVAPWLTLKGLESEEEWEIVRPWIDTPIDFAEVRKHIRKIMAIFSDNDPFVPAMNQKIFRDEISAKIIVEKKKGHFTEDDKIFELPVVLEELLKI
jgi:uncharacterized protein